MAYLELINCWFFFNGSGGFGMVWKGNHFILDHICRTIFWAWVFAGQGKQSGICIHLGVKDLGFGIPVLAGR